MTAKAAAATIGASETCFCDNYNVTRLCVLHHGIDEYVYMGNKYEYRLLQYLRLAYIRALLLVRHL